MNRNDRRVTGFTMVGHGLVHTFELSIPVLMTVWLTEYQVTTATLGTVAAVGYGLFGVGALPGGLMVDRVGARRVIVGCLAGMGLGFLLLSMLPGVAGIAVALAVWGGAASVYHPAGLALISNAVEARGTAFAYHGMAGNVGIAAGPFATAVLLLAVDWRVAAGALALPALAAAVVGVGVRFDETAAVDVGGDEATADGGTDGPTTSTGGGADGPATSTDGGADGPAATADVGSLREFLGASRRLFSAGFLVVFVLVLFNGLYYRGMLTFLPELLAEFLAPLVGGGLPGTGRLAGEFDLSRYLFVGLLSVGVAGQYVGGRLTDAVVPERGLAGALALLVAIALLFVPASSTVPTLLAVSAALGVVLFGIQPISQATIAKYAPAEHRGLSFGYTYLAIFGVGALGASVVGAALTYGTPDLVFVLLAGFAAAALALALLLVVRDR